MDTSLLPQLLERLRSQLQQMQHEEAVRHADVTGTLVALQETLAALRQLLARLR